MTLTLCRTRVVIEGERVNLTCTVTAGDVCSVDGTLTRICEYLLIICNIYYIHSDKPTIEFVVPTEPIRLSSGLPVECKVPRVRRNVHMAVMILGVEQQEYVDGEIQADATYTAHINTTLLVNMRTPQITVECVVIWMNITLTEQRTVTLQCE